MALVHDMAECIVGDITPHDNVPKSEKHKKEEVQLCHLCVYMCVCVCVWVGG
jgi:putative hydrolase of HD superfamily